MRTFALLLAIIQLPSLYGQVVQQEVAPVQLQNAQNSGANQAPAESIGSPQAAAGGPEANATDAETAEFLTLADVIASVYRSFPAIEQARQSATVAQGEQVAAFGAFDTKLYGYSLSEPTGFYRNFRQGLGVSRQTWWGGYVAAGYRIGRGDFQPWYKERETNEGGEFKVALGVPLLRGRAIDASRVAVFQAGISREQVGPEVQVAILSAGREAAQLYWDWVAAGSRLLAQEELLGLAKTRQFQFEQGAIAGKFAQIDVVFNRQLVAERESKRLETEQKFRQAGFKLSLFLRDEVGAPLVPGDDWLPMHFPIIQELPPTEFLSDLELALAQRPELALLSLEVRRLRWEQRLACNDMLPDLDVIVEASQDTGIPASSSNDKGQFEMVVGVQGQVPIQRRKARGKLLQINGKLAQMDQKIRFQQNKVGVEIQNARNALMIAEDLVVQAERAQAAAFDSLTRYRIAFRLGYADLIYLNLLETKANETAIKLVDAQRAWFFAIADLQTALGLDPLEQAMEITALPRSDRLGPGDMPADLDQVPADFDQDWQIHSTGDTPPRQP